MGWIRGRPRALLILFFSLAVFLTGSISAISGEALAERGIWPAITLASLLVALSFALLVLGRVLWITSRIGSLYGGDPSAPKNGGRP